MQVRLLERDKFAEIVEAREAGLWVPEDAGLRKGTVEEVRAVKGRDRALDFVISSSRRDRDRDTINQKGWEAAEWEKNPVVLWAHDHSEPPVAKGFNLRVSGSKVLSSAEFTAHDLNPFGDMIYRMYQAGFMRATSVGFRPLKFKQREPEAGDEGMWPGYDFEKQDLLEFSMVPVGSNPDALMRAHEAGVDTAPMRAWCERYLDGEKLGGKGLSRDMIEASWAAVRSGGIVIDLGKAKVGSDDAEEIDDDFEPQKDVTSIEEVETATDEVSEAVRILGNATRLAVRCAECEKDIDPDANGLFSISTTDDGKLIHPECRKRSTEDRLATIECQIATLAEALKAKNAPEDPESPEDSDVDLDALLAEIDARSAAPSDEKDADQDLEVEDLVEAVGDLARRFISEELGR